jgi:hypothetical protein
MCESCWGQYGRPVHTSPAIERAADLTERLYHFAAVGGPLHVAVDDWNLGDDTIRFCQLEAQRWSPEGLDVQLLEPEEFTEAKALAVELAGLLLSMPEVDRAAAMARREGFVAAEHPTQS